MKARLTLVTVILILSGCRKSKNDTFSNHPDVIIHGHVVESCTDNTPVAGLSIYVIGDGSTDNCVASWEDISAVTDENGDFTIRYDFKDFCSSGSRSLGYRINFGTPKTMISGLPTKVEKETVFNLNLYKKAFTNYAAIIQTSKVYTDQDTLRWFDNGEIQYTPGPFSDGMVIHSYTSGSGVTLHPEKGGGREFPWWFYINGTRVAEARPSGLTAYSCGQINEVPINLPD